MMFKPARVTLTDTTNDGFYVFPSQNPGSAAASAGVPDDPDLCPLAITDGEGNFFCAGLELQYNKVQSSDVQVTITVPDDTWQVTQGQNGTEWEQIEGTNSYATTIPQDEINKVVNEGGVYNDPFNFVNTKTGRRHDPEVFITRPPSKDEGER